MGLTKGRYYAHGTTYLWLHKKFPAIQWDDHALRHSQDGFAYKDYKKPIISVNAPLAYKEIVKLPT